jgi:hypothetical protein
MKQQIIALSQPRETENFYVSFFLLSITEVVEKSEKKKKWEKNKK